MRRPITILALLLAALPLAAAATADVPPRTPKPSASVGASVAATASASVAVSASASTDGDAPELPRIDTIDLPAEASPIPKRDEWKKAKEVVFHDALPSLCRAHVVREWLRVRCSGLPPGAGSVVSGPSKDVVFFSSVPTTSLGRHYFTDISRASIEMIMPLRRGVSRMVQLTQMGGEGGYGWFGQQRIFLLSQQWPEGQAAPAIYLDNRPWRTDDVLGMRFGTKEEAAKQGLTAKWGGLYVLAVEPGSPADEAGAEPGDTIAGLTASDWQDRLALGDGPTFDLLLTRKGIAKQVTLPRRLGK